MELLVLDRTSAAFSDVASVSTAAVKRSPSANFQSTSTLSSMRNVLSTPDLIFEKVSDVSHGFPSFFADFRGPSKLFEDFNTELKAYGEAYRNFKHGMACLPYLGNEQFLKMFKEQNAIDKIRDFEKRSSAQEKFNKKHAAGLSDFAAFSDEAAAVFRKISPMAMYKELEVRLIILKNSREVRELFDAGEGVEVEREDEFLMSNKEFRALVIEKVFREFLTLKIWFINEKFKHVHEFLAKFNDLFKKPENAEKADKWVEQFLRFSMDFGILVKDAKENGIPGFDEGPG